MTHFHINGPCFGTSVVENQKLKVHSSLAQKNTPPHLAKLQVPFNISDHGSRLNDARDRDGRLDNAHHLSSRLDDAIVISPPKNRHPQIDS